MSSGKTMNIYSFEKGKLEVTVFSIHGKNNKPVFKNNDRSKPLKKKKKKCSKLWKWAQNKTKQNINNKKLFNEFSDAFLLGRYSKNLLCSYPSTWKPRFTRTSWISLTSFRSWGAYRTPLSLSPLYQSKAEHVRKILQRNNPWFANQIINIIYK